MDKSHITTDSPVFVGSDPNQRKESLSLYSNPTPTITLERVESPLEAQIALVRKHLMQQLQLGSGLTNEAVGKVILWEKSVHAGVNSIVDDSEKLNPNLLYVGIAGLGGRILTRNRNFLLRSLIPPALLLVSLNHFLPRTYANLSTVVVKAEEEHLPALYAAQQSFSRESSTYLKGINEISLKGFALIRSWFD